MSDETAVATVQREQHGLQLRSLSDYMSFAKIAVESGLSLGHRNPASVVIALQFGAELGLSPMASLRNVHVFSGKPLPSADSLVGVAMSHPDCLYFVPIKQTAEEATWETHRRGNPQPTRYSFTMADAKAAGLGGKDNWKNYPARMLSARAKSFLSRDVYPDRLAGIMSMEEMQDVDDPVVIDATNGAPVVEIERVKVDDDALIAEPQWRHLVQRAKNGGHNLERVSEWLQKMYGCTGQGKVKRRDLDAIIARLDDKSELGSKPEDFGEPEPPTTNGDDAEREAGAEG